MLRLACGKPQSVRTYFYPECVCRYDSDLFSSTKQKWVVAARIGHGHCAAQEAKQCPNCQQKDTNKNPMPHKGNSRQPRVAQTAVSPCASEARFTKSSLGPKILTIGAGKSNLVISTWRRSAQGGRVSVESPRRDRIRFGQIRNQMHFGDASGGSSWFI